MARKAESLRKAPRKLYDKRKQALSAYDKRQAENKRAYDKAQKTRADYAKFQTKRFHNTIQGVLPEGARHG